MKPAAVEDQTFKPHEDELLQAIKNSTDKMFFIKFKATGATSCTWAVVQVDMEETDERRAATKGAYRCRWFGPNPDDVKFKPIRNCRFWPVIHRIDNEGYFWEQQIVSPEKVHGYLERKLDMGWYQLDVNLKKHRLSEHFDFVSMPVTKMSDRMEKWRIDSKQWIPLIMKAHQKGVPTADIDLGPRTGPLRKQAGGEGPGGRTGRGRGRGRRRGRGRSRR